MPTLLLDDGRSATASYGNIATAVLSDFIGHTAAVVAFTIAILREFARLYPEASAVILFAFGAWPDLVFAPLGMAWIVLRIPLRTALWCIGFQPIPDLRKGEHQHPMSSRTRLDQYMFAQGTLPKIIKDVTLLYCQHLRRHASVGRCCSGSSVTSAPRQEYS
jgi:hypothetical protein